MTKIDRRKDLAKLRRKAIESVAERVELALANGPRSGMTADEIAEACPLFSFIDAGQRKEVIDWLVGGGRAQRMKRSRVLQGKAARVEVLMFKY